MKQLSLVLLAMLIGVIAFSCKKKEEQKQTSTNNGGSNPPPSDSTTATIVFDATHTGTFILCDTTENILAIRSSGAPDICTAPKISYKVKNSGTWLMAKICNHPNVNPTDTVVIQMIQIGASGGQAGVMNSYGTYNPIPVNSPTQVTTATCPSPFILIAP